MERPFFSIVLSIYGVEKYLDRCINSILAQDFSNYELILVDDGSKDNCPQMCDTWVEKDKRIRVVHKKNAGLGMARNTGLENSTGKYIFFLDSDDYILPGLLSHVYDFLKRRPVDVVFYGFCRVDGNGVIRERFVPNPEKWVYTDNEEIKNVLLPDFICSNPETGEGHSIRISAWNCCINTSVLRCNDLSFVSERQFISEDIYYYIEAFPYLDSVAFIDDAYYCYCQNEGSLTFSYRPERYKRIKEFYINAINRANELEYNGEVQKRLLISFVATTMACLKMEAANCEKVGYTTAYKRVKNICKDYYLRTAIRKSKFRHYKLSWCIFKGLMLMRQYRLLFGVLLFQYKKRGI